MKKTKEETRLGRGLGALLSQQTEEMLQKNTKLEDLGIRWLDIRKIKANPYQPRQTFDMEKMIELADSIREKGLMQPLIAKEEDGGLYYTLIIGERRLRAAKLAGLEKVPVMIKDANDSDMLEMAVIENVQRQDLTPVEEANAFQQLVQDFKMTLDEVSKKLGKSKSYISNKIRLLRLSKEVLRALQEDEITEGHARAILAIEDRSVQIHALRLIIQNGMNVRQAETLVNKLKKADEQSDRATRKVIDYVLSNNARAVQENFTSLFNLPIRVQPLRDGGKIIIRYSNEKDLAGIVKRLKDV